MSEHSLNINFSHLLLILFFSQWTGEYLHWSPGRGGGGPNETNFSKKLFLEIDFHLQIFQGQIEWWWDGGLWEAGERRPFLM